MTDTIQGTGADVTLTGFGAKFESWAGQVLGARFPTTGFGDKGWATGKVINGRFVGEIRGILITGTPPIPAAGFGDSGWESTFKVSDVVLTADDGLTLTFDAIVTNVHIERDELESVVVFSIASTGPVTPAEPEA